MFSVSPFQIQETWKSSVHTIQGTEFSYSTRTASMYRLAQSSKEILGEDVGKGCDT